MKAQKIFRIVLITGILLQSLACKKTEVVVPPPVAAISANTQAIVAYESITFTDASTGAGASREWVIEGGTPNTATTSPVTAQFTKEGTYNVKLTVKNASGASSSASVSVVVKPVTFKHTVTAGNISGSSNHHTIIDHLATNNNPNAILIVTHNAGTTTAAHNKPLSVWYDGSKWRIFNQNLSPMNSSIGNQFNILVKQPSDKAFVATASGISGNTGILNNAALNNNPNAKFLITQNWSVYNINPIGVYYNAPYWRVFNQNSATMPVGVQFNVVIDDRISIVTAVNPTGGFYSFSQPSTDNQPDALLFATQYWTQIYNANEIGVWFNAGKWTVFNENDVRMPTNAKFMVLSNKQF